MYMGMHLPGKAIPEMTYTVLGGTLNPTHSLIVCKLDYVCGVAVRLLDENNTNGWCSNGRAGTHWIR